MTDIEQAPAQANSQKNELEEQLLEAAAAGRPFWVGEGRHKFRVLLEEGPRTPAYRQRLEDAQVRDSSGGLRYGVTEGTRTPAYRHRIEEAENGGINIILEKGPRTPAYRHRLEDADMRGASGGISITLNEGPRSRGIGYVDNDPTSGFTFDIDEGDRNRVIRVREKREYPWV